MPDPDQKTYFVVTLRGDRGPHSRAEVAELLRAGDIQPSDRLRNAFGRQLGTVEDLLATGASRRRPVAPPPAPRRNPTPIVIAVIAVLAVVALLALRSGGTDPVPQPPLQSAPPVSASPPPTDTQPPPTVPMKKPGRLDGWTITDIGGAVLPPEVDVRPGGRWWVSSAGSDIWHETDQCRLVSKPLPRDGQVTALVHSATGQHSQAKSGVMLRSSIAPAAASVMLSLTPGGGAELLVRARNGGTTESIPARHHGLPRWLRLQRIGARIIPSSSEDGQNWQPAAAPFELEQNLPMIAGVAVCSHEEAVMTSVFSEVSVEPAPEPGSSP